MPNKTTMNTLIMVLLVFALSNQALLAQPSDHSQRSERIIERKPNHSPFTKLQDLIRNAEIYEYLLGHPHFLKLQDMAQRVWEKQTGSKRRVVTWSRRNIISPDNLPVRTPYN